MTDPGTAHEPQSIEALVGEVIASDAAGQAADSRAGKGERRPGKPWLGAPFRAPAKASASTLLGVAPLGDRGGTPPPAAGPVSIAAAAVVAAPPSSAAAAVVGGPAPAEAAKLGVAARGRRGVPPRGPSGPHPTGETGGFRWRRWAPVIAVLAVLLVGAGLVLAGAMGRGPAAGGPTTAATSSAVAASPSAAPGSGEPSPSAGPSPSASASPSAVASASPSAFASPTAGAGASSPPSPSPVLSPSATPLVATPTARPPIVTPRPTATPNITPRPTRTPRITAAPSPTVVPTVITLVAGYTDAGPANPVTVCGTISVAPAEPGAGVAWSITTRNGELIPPTEDENRLDREGLSRIGFAVNSPGTYTVTAVVSLAGGRESRSQDVTVTDLPGTGCP